MPFDFQQLAAPGDLRAWDPRFPPFPWGERAFSERLLQEHLSQAHDLASRRQPLIAAQVSWLMQYLQPGSSLLDATCGPGFHALALAACGHRVTGVDIGPALIDHAREQAAQAGLTATFICADLNQLELAERFDQILLLYGYLHTLPEREGEQLLRRLHAHLRPGGRLLVEARCDATWERRSYREWWGGANDLFGEGTYLALYDHLWDAQAEAEVERYQIFPEQGPPVTYTLTERRIPEVAWVPWLQQLGFRQVTYIREGWPSEQAEGWLLVEGQR